MSRIRANKITDKVGTGAIELEKGAHLPIGMGITGAGGLNITGVVTATSFSGSGSNSITNITTSTLYVGQEISGTGIPTDEVVTISSIVTAGSSNNGTITISKNATANGSGVTLTIASEYGMDTFDHIVYEDATEQTDAYTGNQIQLETQTFTDLGVATEAGEVVNIKTFSGGSGYEIVPTVVATTATIRWSTLAQTTSGQFRAGETITTGDATGTLAVLRTGNASIVASTGTFAVGETVIGATSDGKEIVRFKVAKSNHKKGPFNEPTHVYKANPYYQFTPLYKGTSLLLDSIVPTQSSSANVPPVNNSASSAVVIV